MNKIKLPDFFRFITKRDLLIDKISPPKMKKKITNRLIIVAK